LSGRPNERALPFAPRPEARPRIRALVALFVLAQLVVPLTYYLRDDPYDERFAWRMFSAVRVLDCDVRAREGRAAGGRVEAQAIDLPRTLHAAWITHLRRRHRRVVEAFFERRCEAPGTRWVELASTCRAPDGRLLPPARERFTCEAARSGAAFGSKGGERR
jgi:hypothetical protein